MKEFLDLIWEQEKDRLYITREEFDIGFDGCEFDVYRRDDSSISMIFVVRGPEFHFVKFGTDVHASRDILNKYPGSLIDKHGYALTKTPKEDMRQRRFNERLGFYSVDEDELDIHYKIDHLRKRKPSCQS